jgi:hypothetical protein
MAGSCDYGNEPSGSIKGSTMFHGVDLRERKGSGHDSDDDNTNLQPVWCGGQYFADFVSEPARVVMWQLPGKTSCTCIQGARL